MLRNPGADLPALPSCAALRRPLDLASFTDGIRGEMRKACGPTAVAFDSIYLGRPARTPSRVALPAAWLATVGWRAELAAAGWGPAHGINERGGVSVLSETGR